MPLTRLLTTVSLACLLPMAAMAQTGTPAPAVAEHVPAAVAPMTGDNAPVTHAELPELVKKAILDNPGIIMDAAKKYQEQQAEESRKQSAAAVAKYHDQLFNDTNAPNVGPANADVTIVEFFDYHCGYCKQMLPILTKLVDEDKKVRIIFRDFPILAPDSTTAAEAALAVNQIEKAKYFDYYTALLKHSGAFDEKFLLDEAKKLGISTAKVKADMKKKDISDMIDHNHQLGQEIGVHGTPGLVIGNELFPGAISYDQLKKAVDNVRAGKPAEDASAKQ